MWSSPLFRISFYLLRSFSQRGMMVDEGEDGSVRRSFVTAVVVILAVTVVACW